ncbi:hypothetical protein [Hansschlegelia sp. KR7-227]|uniref:hypothetical protein n=1 Tax=Hansschlegelia sp. KR7-227 TaxID=3400914 RepID=UPI003C100496
MLSPTRQARVLARFEGFSDDKPAEMQAFNRGAIITGDLAEKIVPIGSARWLDEETDEQRAEFGEPPRG